MTLTLSFHVDPRTHFPLVEVPGQDFALFWMPVTKVQIEYFLSETIDSQFDRAWYHERLRNNPRIMPEKLIAQNLLQAFLTHITFYEASVFSQWYGKGFDLPTSEEWYRTLRAFDQIAAHPAFVEQILDLPNIHPRARLLVQSCENALPGYQRLRDTSERKLSHQLMLRSGMLEYVYQDTAYNRCGACGLSLQSGRYGNSGQDTFLHLRHEDVGDRMPNLGLRPILRRPK
jgi:hypothetical protein